MSTFVVHSVSERHTAEGDTIIVLVEVIDFVQYFKVIPTIVNSQIRF